MIFGVPGRPFIFDVTQNEPKRDVPFSSDHGRQRPRRLIVKSKTSEMGGAQAANRVRRRVLAALIVEEEGGKRTLRRQHGEEALAVGGAVVDEELHQRGW